MGDRGKVVRTCDVQTLLKETKANVCASIVLARSFLARRSGSAKELRKSCGTNARDSRWMGASLGFADERYRSVL